MDQVKPNSKMLIRKSATYLQFPDFGGSEFMVEDTVENVMGKSWMNATGNKAAPFYAHRVFQNSLPMDDDVFYGKLPNGMGAIVHRQELESLA